MIYLTNLFFLVACLLSGGHIEDRIQVAEGMFDGSTDWTGYPLPIPMSTLSDATWARIRSDGGNVRVYSAAYPSTAQLPAHVLYLNTGTKTGLLVVKITLDADAAQSVYVRTTGPDVTTPAVSDTYGRNNVYTSLRAAWGLSEGASAGTNGIVDITGGGANGTPTATGISTTTGMFDAKPALAFSGVTNENVGLATSLSFANNSTFCVWLNLDQIPSTAAATYHFAGTSSLSSNGDWDFRMTTADRMAIGRRESGANNNVTGTNNTIVAGDVGTWKFYVFTVPSTGIGCSLKKNLVETVNVANTLSTVTATPNTVTLGNVYDGKMDLPFWFNTALSANQQTALYRNQGTPGTYITRVSTKWVSSFPYLIQ